MMFRKTVVSLCLGLAVQSVPPSAPAQVTGITFAPTPGVVRQPVTLTVAGKGTCGFVVSFGDGNSQDVSGALPQKLTHTYSVAQTYTVVVAPAAPCEGRFTERLQVADKPGDRITGVTLDPEHATVGRGVAIVVEGAGTCTYRVDYGDGNHEDRTKPLPDRLHHVYNAKGSYTIAAVASGTCQGRGERPLDVR